LKVNPGVTSAQMMEQATLNTCPSPETLKNKQEIVRTDFVRILENSQSVTATKQMFASPQIELCML